MLPLRTALAISLLFFLAPMEGRSFPSAAEKAPEGETIAELLETGKAGVPVPLSEVDSVRAKVWEK